MNFRLLSRLLGIVAMLIGATMLFSLPWAHPAIGNRADEQLGGFEWVGFIAILISILVCAAVGAALMWFGRNGTGHLYRKEAMAVVGLSWVLATVLGALPYQLSGTYRGPGVRLFGRANNPQLYDFRQSAWGHWVDVDPLDANAYRCVEFLLRENDGPAVQAHGWNADQLEHRFSFNFDAELRKLAHDENWREVILFPGDPGPGNSVDNYRIRWIRMTFVDSLFESQSGFSTTGATVISNLEDHYLVSHPILFWRSSTHFLGGLGIIVLFVAILGQGSAGKALMRAEMPGPSKEGMQTRMQHTAWVFAAIYMGLNAVLAIILRLFGLTWFDALCHAFGTLATGGFSTYNASLGHFDNAGIEYTVTLFMVLAGTNFTLLYLILLGRPGVMLVDPEWRTYMLVIVVITFLITVFGLAHADFAEAENVGVFTQLSNAVRYGLFQVVSIITTTGYGTHDFNQWNSFGRGVLFLLMFVGGCAGSTGGGMKVIRHILFLKILRLEIEQSFHPTVVRPLRLAGKPLDDPNLRKNILVYFGLILVIFVFSWIFLVSTEPDATWGDVHGQKLIDSATAVAATLNNIGPGLGTVGSTENYGKFTGTAKLLFTWLMMLGRLELFAILVLCVPRFWRSQ